MPNGQTKRDWDDSQGAGQLDDGGGFQRVGAGVQAVPGGCGGGDGGGVVYSGASEQAKAIIAEAQQAAKSGENQRGQHIKKENYGDGLSDFLIIRFDDGRSCSDGRAAANGGANAD